MLGTAQVLVKAEWVGSWEMYLHAITACLPLCAAADLPTYLKSACVYLQKMHALEEENPEVHQKFQSVFHVIRLSRQYWASLCSDHVIEQTLMRSLKRQGGLMWGSGMAEHQRAIWTMSSTVSSSYNVAMQELTTNNYITGEQHKALSTSRVSRDEADLVTVATKLDRFTLFTDDKSLCYIITGLLQMRLSIYMTYSQ